MCSKNAQDYPDMLIRLRELVEKFPLANDELLQIRDEWAKAMGVEAADFSRAHIHQAFLNFLLSDE